MNMDLLRKKESLAAELTKAAMMEQRLIDIDDKLEIDSDTQVAVWACVAVVQNLQTQLINALTIE